MEIKHYGNSPAMVTELYVGFTDEPREAEPIYPSASIRQTYNLAMGNRWGHKQKFATTNAEPYIYGFVRYTDAFGEKRESRYCYRLTRDEREGFRTAGGAAWSRFN
jgi:hypothetical protein